MTHSSPPTLDEWPADRLPVGATLPIHGELYAVHTEGFGMKLAKPMLTAAGVPTDEVGGIAEFAPNAFTRAAHYMEIWQYHRETNVCWRWCVFGDIRQLGLPDSQRRTVLRGDPGFRLVIASARLEMARRAGQAPLVTYVVVHEPALVAPPGLPCVVMEAPAEMKSFAGHRVLLIDPEYRADEREVIEA